MIVHDELWRIRGSKPVLWTIPFYVTWQNKIEGASFPAVPLLRIQQQAVEERLLFHGRKVNGQWMLTRSALRELGEKVESGTDPETLLSWESPRLSQLPKYKPERRQERDAFLDALYQAGVGSSRDEVEHWWYIFCQHALDWLINKESAVDMYFVKLIPLPFRNEWLEMASKRAEERSNHFNSLNKKEFFYKWAGSWAVLAGSPGHTIRRKVELQMLPMWWKQMKRVEEVRRSRLDEFHYAQSVLESITRAIPRAHKIFRDYCGQTHAFRAVFAKSSVAGVRRIRTFIRPERKPTPKWGTSDKYRRGVEYLESRKRKRLLRKNGPLP